MTSLESGARSGPDGELEPLDDPLLRDSALDLATLAAHWAAYARRQPMTAENMTGADRRAQRMGRTSRGLMEQAGFAVAVTARALLNSVDRVSSGRILVLCGPGNNGGDGFVAARHLAEFGLSSYAVLVSGAEQPGAPDARANWDALAEMPLVERIHVGSAQDALLLVNGIERAALVIDGLLGTGINGKLRMPISEAVDVCLRARLRGVPVLAIDTPTALDLSSGTPSEPNVRADVTLTFHRPKHGLRTKLGAAYAGRVLVAPIGIPPEADYG